MRIKQQHYLERVKYSYGGGAGYKEAKQMFSDWIH